MTNFQEVYKDLIKYKVISTDKNNLSPDITSDSDLRRWMRDNMDNHYSEELYRGIRETEEYKRQAEENLKAKAGYEGVRAVAPISMIGVKPPKVRHAGMKQRYKAGTKAEVTSKQGIKEYAKVHYVIVNHHRQVRLRGEHTGRFYSPKKYLYGG